MPKLTGEELAATSLQHGVDPLVTVAIDDGVVATEDDCLLFEGRLNDLVDLRCCAGEISHDAHLSVCVHCQSMLADYQAMLEATKLLGGSHDENGDEDALIVGERAALNRLSADSTRSQIVGWSTLLALLFVVWGASAGIPTEMSLSEGGSPVSVAGQMGPTEIVSGLSLAELSGYPSHLVSVSPLVENAPASGQPFFETPTGRLLSAGLPAVDLALVDIRQLNHIGKYWLHASRLPGIEPWQHSINFAIGWFSQPALPNGKPQCG